MKTLTKMWNNISIKYKLITLTLLMITIFGIMVLVYALPIIEESYINRKREKIAAIVENAIHIIAYLDSKSKQNVITQEEAKAQAIAIIKAMRYGPDKKDYLWINDFYPNMIMHPFRSDLDGKDVSEMADPNGKKLFIEMVKVCKEKGEGFVDYMWQYKDQKDIR